MIKTKLAKLLAILKAKNFILILPLLSSCMTAAKESEEPQRIVRAFFIGNSYTGKWNIPEITRQMAEAKGAKLVYGMHTPGGANFQRHWEEGRALEKLVDGDWDAVVLQDQSFEPVVNPERMYKYALKFCAEIDKIEARKIFFVTWAYKKKPGWYNRIQDPAAKARVDKVFPTMQERLNAAYGEIARRVDGEIAPVGPAWSLARAENPDWVLHAKDNMHPEKLGAYLSALVLYATLFDEKPSDMPGVIFLRKKSANVKITRRVIRVGDSDRKRLETIAGEAIREFRKSPLVETP